MNNLVWSDRPFSNKKLSSSREGLGPALLELEQSANDKGMHQHYSVELPSYYCDTKKTWSWTMNNRQEVGSLIMVYPAEGFFAPAPLPFS